MMDKLKTIAQTMALLILSMVLAGGLHAEYDSIKNSDVANVIHAHPISASGTHTQTRPFRGLPRTLNQSVQIQGTGTSPNYKVEILVSLDYDPEHGVAGTFSKPEQGGDIGTFTDQNAHVVALGVPASVAHKLKITELGGANSITIEAYELSQ